MNPVPRRRGRPRGIFFQCLIKRLLIVEAIFTGVKIAEVARQLGVSRSWASREAHAPGARQLVANVLAMNAEQMLHLFDRSVQVIENALEAEKVVRRNGRLINLGPDHEVRLKAAELAFELTKAAEPEKPESWLLADIEPIRWRSRSCTHGRRLSRGR